MCEECSNSQSLAGGSRRRRLWELPHQCHCPVVGVCFPMSALRHLLSKALGSKSTSDDYDIHVGAVSECTRRNRLSELLQKDLESRYFTTIQAFRAAKTTEAVAELWAVAVNKGDVPGAFWATLTHPRCDDTLQEFVLRGMHMLQHQAGAAQRVDIARFNDLMKENRVLGQELGKAQERCTRLMNEKSAEIERLNAQLVQQRAIIIGRESRIAFLVQDLEQIKASLPEYENAVKLRKKNEQLSLRKAELEVQNRQLQHQMSEAQRLLTLREKEQLPASKNTPQAETDKHLPIMQLKEKRILCVGGRNGNISNYREVIEHAGGHFAHHDGGVEDNQGALDSVLAAADLVICQSGCISHNAYWRVKDFCKRTGKQCVFVENPSTSSLTRTLQRMSGTDAAAQDVDNAAIE